MKMACDGDYIFIRLDQIGVKIPSYDPLCSSEGWRLEPTTCQGSAHPPSRSNTPPQPPSPHQPTSPQIEPTVCQTPFKTDSHGISDSDAATAHTEDHVMKGREAREILCKDSILPGTMFNAPSGSSHDIPSPSKNKDACTKSNSNRIPMKHSLPSAVSEKPNKKRKHNMEPQVKRQCCFCDQKLSRKQAWKNHLNRKHSTQFYVEFKDLEQVVTIREHGLTSAGQDIEEHVVSSPQEGLEVVKASSENQVSNPIFISTSTGSSSSSSNEAATIIVQTPGSTLPLATITPLSEDGQKDIRTGSTANATGNSTLSELDLLLQSLGDQPQKQLQLTTEEFNARFFVT